MSKDNHGWAVVVVGIIIAAIIYLAMRSRAGPGSDIPDYLDPDDNGGSDDPWRMGGYGYMVVRVLEDSVSGPPVDGATVGIYIDGLLFVQGITGADGRTEAFRMPSGKGCGAYVAKAGWMEAVGGMAGGVVIGDTFEWLIVMGRL